MLKKTDLLLYLVFIIPIFMIIILVLHARIHPFDLKPKYPYLYTALSKQDSDQCASLLLEEIYNRTKSLLNKNKSFKVDCTHASIYIYNFETASSTPISLEQAKKITFCGTANYPTQSPDGFELNTCDNDVQSWWWDANVFISCLRKEHYLKKIVLRTSAPQEQYLKVNFLGWIKVD